MPQPADTAKRQMARDDVPRAVQYAVAGAVPKWWVVRRAKALGAVDLLPLEWRREADAITSLRWTGEPAPGDTLPAGAGADETAEPAALAASGAPGGSSEPSARSGAAELAAELLDSADQGETALEDVVSTVASALVRASAGGLETPFLLGLGDGARAFCSESGADWSADPCVAALWEGADSALAALAPRALTADGDPVGDGERHVRTTGGAKMFHVPVGSLILPDGRVVTGADDVEAHIDANPGEVHHIVTADPVSGARQLTPVKLSTGGALKSGDHIVDHEAGVRHAVSAVAPDAKKTTMLASRPAETGPGGVPVTVPQGSVRLTLRNRDRVLVEQPRAPGSPTAAAQAAEQSARPPIGAGAPAAGAASAKESAGAETESAGSGTAGSAERAASAPKPPALPPAAPAPATVRKPAESGPAPVKKLLPTDQSAFAPKTVTAKPSKPVVTPAAPAAPAAKPPAKTAVDRTAVHAPRTGPAPETARDPATLPRAKSVDYGHDVLAGRGEDGLPPVRDSDLDPYQKGLLGDLAKLHKLAQGMTPTTPEGEKLRTKLAKRVEAVGDAVREPVPSDPDDAADTRTKLRQSVRSTVDDTLGELRGMGVDTSAAEKKTARVTGEVDTKTASAADDAADMAKQGPSALARAIEGFDLSKSFGENLKTLAHSALEEFAKYLIGKAAREDDPDKRQQYYDKLRDVSTELGRRAKQANSARKTVLAAKHAATAAKLADAKQKKAAAAAARAAEPAKPSAARRAAEWLVPPPAAKKRVPPAAAVRTAKPSAAPAAAARTARTGAPVGKAGKRAAQAAEIK